MPKVLSEKSFFATLEGVDFVAVCDLHDDRAQRNGNLYPTHGLGPVAQYMSLARGEDTFGRLVAFSSPAKGRALYAQKSDKLTDPAWKTLEFKGGDMNTSIIKTALGRTIMVQWDETSPRPYSRLNLIQGTKGTLAGFPNRMAVAGLTKTTKPLGIIA